MAIDGAILNGICHLYKLVSKMKRFLNLVRVDMHFHSMLVVYLCRARNSLQ